MSRLGTRSRKSMSEGFRNYHIEVTFHAPLSFVYNWCTNYTPQDFKYGGEKGERRILRRSSKRIVFENLYDIGKGWGWERHTVTLNPPNAWHSEGRGNYSESSLDYKLRELPDNNTKLDMRWRSRPGPMSTGRRGSVRSIENYVRLLWQQRAKFVEKEFQSLHRVSKSKLFRRET